MSAVRRLVATIRSSDDRNGTISVKLSLALLHVYLITGELLRAFRAGAKRMRSGFQEQR